MAKNRLQRAIHSISLLEELLDLGLRDRCHIDGKSEPRGRLFQHLLCLSAELLKLLASRYSYATGLPLVTSWS